MSRAKTRDAATARPRRWVGSWTDVEQAQLETMLMATPAQRLAWLEEALRLALRLPAPSGTIAPPREAVQEHPRDRRREPVHPVDRLVGITDEVISTLERTPARSSREVAPQAVGGVGAE